MRHRLQPLAIFMNRQDSITLGKIIFGFTLMFGAGEESGGAGMDAPTAGITHLGINVHYRENGRQR